MMNFVHHLFYMITYPLRAVVYSPGKLFAPFRKLAKLSLPAKVAILLFLFMVTGVVAVFIVKYNYRTRAAWPLFTQWWWLIAILVVVIPIVAYYALRAWLEGEISPFPDIDHAWKAGLAEMQQQGLDLSQIPLFLILGSSGEDQERSLLAASGLDLNMEETPRGPAALHWYGNPSGIYLTCTRVGCLGKLASMAEEVAALENVDPGPVLPRPADAPIYQTIVTDDEEMAADSEAQPDGFQKSPSSDIRGTMQIGSNPLGSDDFPSPAGAPSERRPVKLDHDDAIKEARRFEYLCRLIRRQRQPLCPINGILTLLPFRLIQRSEIDAIEMQRAVKKDLSNVLDVLMLRCPVTALVVGMEQEMGFREFVRRVGRERAASHRFGKGYSLSNPSSPEWMKAVSAHACGSFEDWVYTLFREEGSLSRPGNTKLYSLLVKMRGQVQDRLARVLANGFSASVFGKLGDRQDQQTEGLLFSGCYFAATGDTEDRRAFVKSVFGKLPEQQEEVQWTQAALGQDQKLQQIAQAVLVYCTALLLGLVGIIACWIFGS